MSSYKFNIKQFLGTLLMCVGLSVFAQQDPSFSLYQYNMGIVNPAYAGSGESIELNLIFRTQWAGIEGSPKTQSINLSVPVSERVGLGLSVVNDKVFVLKETDIYADFSYKLPLGNKSDLFLGLKAGGSAINIDLISLGINDPLFSEDVSKFNPNIGMGAYLRGDKYYLNLSAPAMLSSKRYEKEGVLVTKATDKLHFYMGAGYLFSFSDALQFSPSILGRIVEGAPVTVDVTGMFTIQEKTEVGISYRINESVSAIAMFKYVEWLHFGYAYEHTTSPVGSYNNGSHEFLLKILFLNKK